MISSKALGPLSSNSSSFPPCSQYEITANIPEIEAYLSQNEPVFAFENASGVKAYSCVK